MQVLNGGVRGRLAYGVFIALALAESLMAVLRTVSIHFPHVFTLPAHRRGQSAEAASCLQSTSLQRLP